MGGRTGVGGVRLPVCVRGRKCGLRHGWFRLRMFVKVLAGTGMGRNVRVG